MMKMERVKGIEPSSSEWHSEILTIKLHPHIKVFNFHFWRKSIVFLFFNFFIKQPISSTLLILKQSPLESPPFHFLKVLVKYLFLFDDVYKDLLLSSHVLHSCDYKLL